MQPQTKSSRRHFARVALGGVALGVAGFFGFEKCAWRELPREGGTRRWQRGKFIHLDTNGDGIVDEEQYRFDRPNHALVKRDLDFDGYFDIRYELQSGVATRIEKIHERAPRH